MSFKPLLAMLTLMGMSTLVYAGHIDLALRSKELSAHLNQIKEMESNTFCKHNINSAHGFVSDAVIFYIKNDLSLGYISIKQAIDKLEIALNQTCRLKSEIKFRKRDAENILKDTM